MGQEEPSSDALTMPFPIGGPASSAWREQAFSRAGDYRFLARLLLPRGTAYEREVLAALERKIDAAENVPGWSRRLIDFLTGAGVERTNSQLDSVETDLLRLMPDPYLRGQLPNLVAHVQDHLPEGDPRRTEVETVAEAVRGRAPNTPLRDLERDQVVGAVRAASLEARRSIRRVRSFRNVLLVSALILSLCVAGITLLGVLAPEKIPLCFTPETVDSVNVVCPTETLSVEASGSSTVMPSQQELDVNMRNTANAWDMPLIEIVGLLSAALAGALALRSIRGTSTPYSLPVAVAVLKLPSGALTAVIGLLLMRGGFVPGLSALDSSAQIIAWAIVFGYSQQILTRLVDRQANSVLENVSQPSGASVSPSTTPAPAAPAAS